MTADDITIDSNYLDIDKYGNIKLTDNGSWGSGRLIAKNSNDNNQYSTISSDGLYSVSKYNGDIAGTYASSQFVIGNSQDGGLTDAYGIFGDLGSNNNNPKLLIYSPNSQTEITPSGITTPTVTQTSLAEKKKNFKKLENALDIIKDIDIYKYNLKDEEDNTKEHIGFVIGDKYNYSEEVTSKNNDGADLYSFVSVCCKAIQEQQEEIQELKAKIEKLEKGE